MTVIDMVVPEAAHQDMFNTLEQRRDPAHTRALTSDALRSAVQNAGLKLLTPQPGRTFSTASGGWSRRALRPRMQRPSELHGTPSLKAGRAPAWVLDFRMEDRVRPLLGPLGRRGADLAASRPDVL